MSASGSRGFAPENTADTYRILKNIIISFRYGKKLSLFLLGDWSARPSDVDWEKARRPNLTLKRVNVDFPAWVVEALDRQARRLGVTRQALVKLWIAERLEKAT